LLEDIEKSELEILSLLSGLQCWEDGCFSERTRRLYIPLSIMAILTYQAGNRHYSMSGAAVRKAVAKLALVQGMTKTTVLSHWGSTSVVH